MRKQHGGKGRMTKATTTVLDPVKEKAAQARLEEQKNRDRCATPAPPRPAPPCPAPSCKGESLALSTLC